MSDNEQPKCVHTPPTDDRLLRIREIVGDPKANPPIEPIVPVCRASWWNGVKDGRFPQPVKFVSITAWRKSDVMALLEKGSGCDDR